MSTKKSTELLHKMKNLGTTSESDGSIDSSPSLESCREIKISNGDLSGNAFNNQHIQDSPKKMTRRNSEWEILEGLKEGQRFDRKPDMFSGYLHKKRKWPLKGWHKRYFILDKGLLSYGKGPSEIARGKIHARVDIGLSVISTKNKRKRIDIDADELIHHLKAKHYEIFLQWVEQFKEHRLYRQHVLTFGNVKYVQGRVLRDTNKVDKSSAAELLLQESKEVKTQLTPPHLTAWLINSNTSLDKATKEVEDLQRDLKKLSNIFKELETAIVNSELVPSFANCLASSLKENVYSNSSSPLSSITYHADRPIASYPPISTPENQSEMQSKDSSIKSHNDFLFLAKDIHWKLLSVLEILRSENDRLKNSFASNTNSSGYQTVINNLQNDLIQVVQQNNKLQKRLDMIHVSSNTNDLTEPTLTSALAYDATLYVNTHSSTDVFFDAEEFHNTDNGNTGVMDSCAAVSDTSSEAGSISSEEGSVSSDNSECATADYNTSSHTSESMVNVQNMTGHREKLPCPKPNTEGLSLWSLLRKNIGVDLSRISMPVALNEPLNMLQRLCEELEYSELLDKAVEVTDPYERMVYVAAFAVSSYCSSYYRAGSKPFNPLLGETYECIREDKGFRFLAEQVSHHPPVSVCHAESKNFIFWQDIRIKTKFWGKSMEFQPLGHVNLKIFADEQDYYHWNKVTTCVHNLFSGQRWADLSGELKITNSNRNITCKLTFVKPNYWSAKRHEVYGNVYDENGSVVRKLYGKWNESLYYCGVPPSAKCIWRSGTMPEDYELYYGFTRFAVELNELDYDMAKVLPKTDTRFRPDQRLLEEGDLNAAEAMKSQLEQKQRERRTLMESMNIHYEPRWFRLRTDAHTNEEFWEYNGKYWEMRKNPGFSNMSFEQLW